MSTVDIASLSTEERLALLERLWDSLCVDPSAIPLTRAQRDELDRRLDELEAEGPTGKSWETVVSGIKARA